MAVPLTEQADPQTPERRHAAQPPAPRGRRGRRITIALLACLLAFIGVGMGAAAWTISHYGGQVERISGAFPSGVRPEAAQARPGGSAPLTFLLLGEDSGAGARETRAGSISLVRFAGDREHTQVMSFPSALSPDGPNGDRRTLDAIYKADGVAGVVQAMETMTNVRVNDVAVLDFAGFQTVTDAVGGIELAVPADVTTAQRSFRAGTQRLDGAAALAYIRPAQSGAADTGTIGRQQQVINALFSTVVQQGLLSDVGKLTRTLDAVSGALQVDDTLSNTDLVGLGFSLRNVTAANVSYLTVPVAGGAEAGGSPVTYLDDARDDALWRYLRDDTLAAHVTEFG